MDSIQIIKSPPAVALIGEGLKYELQRTYASTTGKAQLVITLQSESQAYPNNNMKLELPTGVLTFVFTENPDESGLQVTEPNIDEPIMQYAPKLATEFNQNYYINHNYIVTVDASDRIVITARETGSAYNLSFVSSTVPGLTEYSNTDGIDDSTDSDYKIYMGVCLFNENPALPTPLAEELIPVSNQEIAKSNVAAYLEDHLQTSFHFPFNGTLAFEVPNAVVRYFIRYAEYIASTLQKVYNDADAPHYAIAGKLRQLDSDYLTDNATNYFDNAIQQRFLTAAPLSKTTFPEVPERLFFFLFSTGLRVMLKAVYSNSETTTQLMTIDQENYTIVELHVGASELFTGSDLSDLVSYAIWIIDDKDETISEVRTFVMDHTDYLNVRSVFFKNSFHMWDVINCTGVMKVSNKVNRDEMLVLNNEAFRTRILLAESETTYEINSGWLMDGKTASRWSEDLQLSTEAYLVYGDALLPIVPTTGKLVMEEDREYNYSLALTFKPDYENEAYSNLVSDETTSYADKLIDSIFSLYASMVAADSGTVNNPDTVVSVYRFLISN